EQVTVRRMRVQKIEEEGADGTELCQPVAMSYCQTRDDRCRNVSGDGSLIGSGERHEGSWPYVERHVNARDTHAPVIAPFSRTAASANRPRFGRQNHLSGASFGQRSAHLRNRLAGES